MRQSNRWPWTVLACLAAIVSIVAPPAAQAAPSLAQSLAPDSRPVLLRDGVLVDAGRGVAYVMNREGRLDALRTADGAVLWTSAEAVKPLLVTGELLVAQAEATAPGKLPVVTLDRGAGKVVARASIDLPTGLWARLADGPRTSFRAVAAPLDGRVLVSWESKRTAKGAEHQGYVPSPMEGQAPDAGPAAIAARLEVEETRGAAVLDPRSGAVAIGEKAAAAALAAPGLHAFDGLVDVPGRKFLSADGSHVLVSRLADARQVTGRYHWEIYTRAGARVGEMESDVSAARFVVAGNLALVEGRPYGVRGEEGLTGAPLRVRAVDLANGLEAWAQPILQVEFVGPFPP